MRPTRPQAVGGARLVAVGVGQRFRRLGADRRMRWVIELRMARFVSRSLRVGEIGRAAECLGYVASALQLNRGETYMSVGREPMLL